MKHNIAWFQIVMNYFLLQTAQISQCTENLFYNNFGLFLRNHFVFLYIFWQLWSWTIFKFKYSTIFLYVNFNDSLQFGYVGMIESLLDLGFSLNMFINLIAMTLTYIWSKCYPLNSHLFVWFYIIAFVDLTKTTWTK